MITKAKISRARRANRIRTKLARQANGRPRLSVFRSSLHIYAQIIDDAGGRTLAAASSNDKELRAKLSKGSTVDAAKVVGVELANRAIKAGIKQVVFDRGGYLFHGRVKALADGAREAGLDF